jgi:hypothetical protein
LDYANESGNSEIIVLVKGVIDAADSEDTVSGEAGNTKDQQFSEPEYKEEEDGDKTAETNSEE